MTAKPNNLKINMRPLLIILAFFLPFSIIHGQDSLLWEFSTEGRVFSSPVADKDYIYIGSNDSCLYALHRTSGKLKWKFKSKGKIKSKPLLYDGSIIFNGTDGLIYSLDKTNARVQWTFKTGGEKRHDLWDYYLSSPVFYENRVFVGSGDGNVYAIEPNSGNLIWKFKTGGIVHATPLVGNNKVYIGSFDGFFYALDYDTGDLTWKFKTVGDTYFPLGGIQRGAALYKKAVIFGSRDYNIYSLNIETGRGLWNMKEKGSWIIATPLVFEDDIYFGTSDSHKFYGLNANNGDLKWSIPLNMRVYGQATSHNDKIIFGCFNGKLYQLDRITGEVEQIFQTKGSKKNYYSVFDENDSFKPGFEIYGKDTEASEKKILDLGAIHSSPLVDNEIVYFGDANGIIYAVQLK